MKIKIFDTLTPIKNEDGYLDLDDKLIERLDEMLNTHDIAHAFAYPPQSLTEKYPEAAVILFYNDEDSTEVGLIYTLFCKKYRKAKNDKVAMALSKISKDLLKEA